MTAIKDTVELLKRNWEQISRELYATKAEISKLELRHRDLISQLEGLLKTFDVLKHRPKGLMIPPELRFKPDSTLGDSIEQVLAEFGPLTRKALLETLQSAGRLQSKNPRVVLANALKRDTKNRFEVNDGKVSLTKSAGGSPSFEMEPLDSRQVTERY